MLICQSVCQSRWDFYSNVQHFLQLKVAGISLLLISSCFFCLPELRLITQSFKFTLIIILGICVSLPSLVSFLVADPSYLFSWVEWVWVVLLLFLIIAISFII